MLALHACTLMLANITLEAGVSNREKRNEPFRGVALAAIQPLNREIDGTSFQIDELNRCRFVCR